MKKRYKKMKPFVRALFRPVRSLLKTFFPVLYVKWQYYHITGNKLDLKNPIRYTEKLQYLRMFVYPKDKTAIQCTDRVGCRDYLKGLGLDRYLIPVQGVYDKFEDIDFPGLRYPLIMKATHACGCNRILFENEDVDYHKLQKTFRGFLKTDYGKKTVEKHYSPVKPRILIENFIGENRTLPVEYKIHVYNGKARHLYAVTGRGVDIRYTNLLTDWTPFDGSQFNNWKKADVTPPRPDNFDEMVLLAEKLAAPFPFVRVDLYNINGLIYFGEMTFTPAKGTLKLDDDGTDYLMGSWLDISRYTNYEKK